MKKGTERSVPFFFAAIEKGARIDAFIDGPVIK